jgi:hypothetical protein
LIEMFRRTLPTDRGHRAAVVVPFHFTPPRYSTPAPSRASYASQ